MNKLKMPTKGNSAAMLAELQAEHAAEDTEINDTTMQPEPAAAPVVPHNPDGQASSPPPSRLSREERIAFALDRAASDELTVVTVRIPAILNHYLDEYVARRRSVNPKSKYRKQDAIAEAFAAFYADHPLPAIPPGEVLP